MSKKNKDSEGIKIYNIFPRLVGEIDNWWYHILRAKDMDFNWIYINPFHLTGDSGSIYSIKDHFSYNPIFFPFQDNGQPEKLLKKLIKDAKGLGLHVIADLVINHTSKQSPLIYTHPEWFRKDCNGRLINPGAMDKGKMVYWRDLVEIDNASSIDKKSLWSYWISVTKHYLDLGFEGFRCDAAYQVPSDLWCFIIKRIKNISPDVKFLAETLGCSIDQTLEVANSGFDYIFNSFKWWNLQEPWFIDQHRQTQPVIPSVSFPESHDTKRLAAELRDNLPAIKQRYIISALISKGVMVPIGFEFGFHKKLNVKHTTPQDWEERIFDISGFIKMVNQLKSSYKIFNQETPLKMIQTHTPDIKIILKSSENDEKSLLIINQNKSHSRLLALNLKDILINAKTKDISIEHSLSDVPSFLKIKLMPSEVKILYQAP